MDLATLAGLIVGIGAVLAAFLMDGGSLGALFHLPAVIIVIFGTLGAATVTTSFSTLANIPNLLKIVFTASNSNSIQQIDSIVALAEKARREGILGLEKNFRQTSNPFFKKAIQLVIDGTEVTQMRNILETEMAYTGERHQTGIKFFQKLGGFSPTLGIIGTVLGLIHALSRVDEPGNIAIAIAGAFIATLWGIAMANLCYLPISDKLRYRHRQETESLELILEGMISIQSGESPRMIRNKLLSFLTPQQRYNK
ncbi:MAG: flagellar motor protein [candidate division Zixibacteria bacterium]|nr:flagellar motor protein [candidate division Zixibacteria bacterium]